MTDHRRIRRSGPQSHTSVFQALRDITGQTQPQDPSAWRRWYDNPALTLSYNPLALANPPGRDTRNTGRRRLIAAALLALAAASGLGAAGRAPQTVQAPEPKARPDLVRQPYSAADVDFMAGMIPHHAQAVVMAGWAASHGARPDVRVLCERILVGQRDEIEFMRTWLRDRGETVPAANATHHRMKMNGVEHDMLMPGMLSPEDMAQLDKARGAEWDRLFLAGMIRHHQGAIKMVDELFEAYGALQDEDVYKFVSDVYADQSIEIERMGKMLNGAKK